MQRRIILLAQSNIEIHCLVQDKSQYVMPSTLTQQQCPDQIVDGSCEEGWKSLPDIIDATLYPKWVVNNNKGPVYQTARIDMAKVMRAVIILQGKHSTRLAQRGSKKLSLDSPSLSHDCYDVMPTILSMLGQPDSDFTDKSAILACVPLHSLDSPSLPGGLGQHSGNPLGLLPLPYPSLFWLSFNSVALPLLLPLYGKFQFCCVSTSAIPLWHIIGMASTQYSLNLDYPPTMYAVGCKPFPAVGMPTIPVHMVDLWYFGDQTAQFWSNFPAKIWNFTSYIIHVFF
ncbi:hypothetical protein ARMGADRAFT_1034150 [Armillaria gallica]|uniref:Uncharacterized protein n=1 Tax=Armillaria gallica TaxID=47427 RepID=A0A2H3D283_ARMGA|nr:hypothetical protein ARMGADRAFT_1034150 [Armillaria gallica]